ncbi:urea ABC transporter permease subunit UrtB [Thalassolituus marinus]|uniref:Urea ABC transporter permease subunit UrtB n=1 Tax=Thalassolituus marinus TaxID=671053 RepID=A0ABS7ZLK4_9GAMM|nr:urea ABC transporter permease subunit UrtB [Thalassolituus marinus]
MRMYCRQIFLALALLVSFTGQVLAAQDADNLKALTSQLIAANYAEKEQLAGQIAALDDERVLPILSALLEGELFYKKDDEQILIVKGDAINNAFSGDAVDVPGKRDKKKIGVNNSLRGELRSLIARAQINSRKESVRLDAAANLLKNSADVELTLVNEALAKETSSDVKDILSLVRGLILLKSEDQAERITALELLDGSLYPEVRASLNQFISGFSEEEIKTRKTEYTAATKSLASIETLVEMNGYIENLYFGLALGAVLLLAAIGLAITFGVMGVINMAHGEMIMLGAYTTYVVQQLMPDHTGLSLVVSIPAAFLVAGAVGVAIERGVIRHLYGRPLETLLATFGISLILQQAVRSVFSPLNREVATPDWMAGTFMLNPALELTWNRLYIIIFSLLVLATLALVLKRTLFGLQMRAVTMNRPMASSMGIRTGWVDALTFGLGSGIAGIAGVALSQLTNVGPNLGQAYIIDSFMVVVFGGVGNLWGTLVAAMSLGVANKIFEPIAGAVLAKILVLVFIILFIQKRPRGLFALKGRAVENG